MKCKERCFYVYEHISPSGKVYIGQTNNLRKRWYPSNYKGCEIFYRAIQKYGWDNLIHRVIARKCTKQEADYLEKRLIAFYKAQGISYNITDGGSGLLGCIPWNKGTKGQMPPTWNKGLSWSDEIREKISKTKKGRKLGKQTPLHILHKAEKRKVPILQFDVDGRYIREWASAKNVEEAKGFNRKAIGACLNNKSNSAFGYIWVYKNNFSMCDVLDKAQKYIKGTKYFMKHSIPDYINPVGLNSIDKILNML